MTAPQVYPLATQDSQAIPMDVAKGISAFLVVITSAVHHEFTIPADYFICSIVATQDCALRIGAALPSALVVETAYSNTMFLQAEVIYDVILTPGTASVVGLSTSNGYLRISALQQWGALQQPNQANIG